MRIIACAVAFAVSTVITFADELKDDELRKQVIGKWQLSTNYPPVHVETLAEYKQDGTFVNRESYTTATESTNIVVRGTWSVKGKILTWQITQSSFPEIFPVGMTGDEEILEIDATHMKYKVKDDIVVESRIQEPKTSEKKDTSSQSSEPAKNGAPK